MFVKGDSLDNVHIVTSVSDILGVCQMTMEKGEGGSRSMCRLAPPHPSKKEMGKGD